MAKDKEQPERLVRSRRQNTSAKTRQALGSALRREYQNVLNEPIPDKLNALIQKLRASERKP
ncbi:MAG: NepR family anti-sigma factor [Pseudomonadota bacterium]